MEKEDSDLLMSSIIEYLSKCGFASIAEDLKSAAKINSEENAVEATEDYFPHLPKPDPSNPIFKAYIGPPVNPPFFAFLEESDVLRVPNRLMLCNMHKGTKVTGVQRFFKEVGVVTLFVSPLTIQIPSRRKSDTGESSGSDKKIVTSEGYVEFNSVEDTKKAAKLHGSFMGVMSGKRTREGVEEVIDGRPVFIDVVRNDLHTVFVSGWDKEYEILDEAALTRIINGIAGVEVISCLSPENEVFVYFLIRVDKRIASKFAKSLSLSDAESMTLSGDNVVTIREVVLKEEFLKAIEGNRST